MPFDTIQQGIEALQQHMHHECQVEEGFLYLPLFGKRFSSNEAAAEDLANSMSDFISDANTKRVCALLGDGGSGKSVFLKQFTLKFLNGYASGKPIPLFISLPLLTDPLHAAIEETLRKIGFNEAQIAELKVNYLFVFILDGYDEIHQLQNLYVSNRLSEWNAKTIISCRSQYLYNKEHPNLYFMPLENERPQPHLLQTLYVAPFNQDQIKQYLGMAVNPDPRRAAAPWSS